MTDTHSPDQPNNKSNGVKVEPAQAEPAGTNGHSTDSKKRRRRLEPVAPPEPAQAFTDQAAYDYPPRPGVRWRLIIWSVLLTLGGLLLVAYGQAFFNATAPDSTPAASAAAAIPLTPTATATPWPTPADQPPAFTFAEPTSLPTPPPGGRNLLLQDAAGQFGWAASHEPEPLRRNYLGDSFIYAGALEGRRYRAILKFDLSDIPRGTEIQAASLRLTGLRADQLGETGRWQLHLLPSELDYQWADVDYRQLAQAEPLSSFEPPLSADQLGVDQVNQFDFTPEQLRLLEQRVLEGNQPAQRSVTFRIDGPAEGDNLFAWANRSASNQSQGPELFLSLGPEPAQTPPPHYVVVTSTPTPESVMTALAISVKMTAQATRQGTATPPPPYWVTPLVVTPTPTPENEATAQVDRAIATAIAVTTGEPPPNLQVVTPTPTPLFVIITSTPTPEAVETAVALSLQMTAEAQRAGSATPLPENWVTPLVVTSTPPPENTATVQYQQALAMTTGTPTPLPANAQTATPTPVAMAAPPLASPTPTATPSPTPQNIPVALLGKVLFLSDREGATEAERERADRLRVTPQVTPQPYAFDPATGQLERLTARWPYDVAAARDSWSPDLQYEAYNKALLWTNVDRKPTEELAIHVYDHFYDVERQVTRMGAGIVYDPAWSPVSDELAFVATESRNDEIWLIRRDGTDPRQLTRNDWPWDKHPSWSPDGQQIVFYSNRTGTNQLWIMNRDGGNQRLLLDPNPYNDFDPVWVKYLEPAPGFERLPDWRFVKPDGEVHR